MREATGHCTQFQPTLYIIKVIKNLLNNIKTAFIKDLDKIVIPKYVIFNINSSSIFEVNDWNFYKDIYEILDTIIIEYNLT